MKILKQTLLSILSAVITMAIVYGGYTIYAQDEDLNFRQAGKGLDFVENTYNEAMNQYFNKKLEHLVQILDEPNFADNPDFQAPDEGQECADTNVSTYCVAMGATDMYIDLLKTLDEMQGTIVRSNDSSSVNDVVLSTTQRDKRISEIIDESKLVLDGALATYNEFRLAYPMHKQYEQVINNLVNYRDALKALHSDISKFPGKFIDATSSYCK